MEKKTIGAFLAALRKANGLTQKQLAEKLNVSDKAVSRWERDECAPDLSLIPVLAEIYGVTADEILRGQRRDPDTPIQAPDNTRVEKQLKRLVSSAQTKFRIRSILAIAIALVGILAEALCNHGLNQAAIGFMVGCVFFVGAATCQIIFLILALSAITADELDADMVVPCKKSMIRISELIMSGVFVVLVGSIPLITLTEGQPYLGINAQWVFDEGIELSLVTAVLCAAISHLINRKISVAQSPKTSETSGRVSAATRRLIARCGGFLLVYLIVIFTAQYCTNYFFLQKPHQYTPHERFDTMLEFKEYIETPMDPIGRPMKLTNAHSEPYTDGSKEMFLHYTTEDGGEYILSNKTDIVQLHYTYTEDGFTYYTIPVDTEETLLHANLSVVHIEVNSDTHLTPIYTFTNKQLEQGNFILGFINFSFLALYLGGIVATIIVFVVKCKKQIDAPCTETQEPPSAPA